MRWLHESREAHPLLEPEGRFLLCQFSCMWDCHTAMCRNIMECYVTRCRELPWRHDTHTTSYLQKVYWKTCPKYAKRRPNHSKGPPNGPKNRTFRYPGRPLDPTRQGRLKNDSKMMPRGSPERPIWGQKSALENKKTSQTKKKNSMTKKFENLTKKYRNPSLTNLKMYGFV